MKKFGIILVIVGVIALVYGGFSYAQNREVLDVGPLEINSTENDFPTAAVVGGLVLITGFILLIRGNRHHSRPL